MQSRLLFARTGNVRPRSDWIHASRSVHLRSRHSFLRTIQISSAARVAAQKRETILEDVASKAHSVPQPAGDTTEQDASHHCFEEMDSEERPIRSRTGPPTVQKPLPASNDVNSSQGAFRLRGGIGLDRRHTVSRLEGMTKNENPLQVALRVVQHAENEALARAEAAQEEERSHAISRAARLEEEERARDIENLQNLLPLSKNKLRAVAWILSATTTEDAAQRILSSECPEPVYVVSEILRCDGIATKTFRNLVKYSWRHCTDPLSSSSQPMFVQEKAFMVMVCRLLDHARKILAPAVVSIARMMVRYFEQLAASSPMTESKFDAKRHARISSYYNIILYRLSLPAHINPFKSMAQNWKAQRVLLESANSFQPPLELNRLSYRSVCVVLLALRKSPQEEKFVSLLERSWPPWRIEQDGMDAERSEHEDLSRTNQAMARMVEAGYQEEPIDRALKILGGRESDGTPTVQTRYLLNLMAPPSIPLAATSPAIETPGSFTEASAWPHNPWRYVPSSGPYKGPRLSHKAVEWAAKVEATRDVQEAWAAFSSFPSETGARSTGMYFAMMKKLEYDDKLAYSGERTSELPGDGPEVFPVADDNLSDDMKLRLKPPHRDELYASMIDEGHSPQGRFLVFLLRHARTPSNAVRYLLDSDLEPLDVQKLINPNRSIAPKPSLDCISQPILVAFIHFICHPALWNNVRTVTEFSASHLEHDPFGHALHVLQCQQRVYRPAWNAFFKGVARQGISLDPTRDMAWNDQASWALLLHAYHKSLELGLEFDHDGFHFMCRGLEKAILAANKSVDILNEQNPMARGLQLLKDLFREMGEKLDDEFDLPRLAFRLGGTQLHSYIRVVGLSRDIEELKYIVEWIVENSDWLGEEADESRNGRTRLRRALVAIRLFADEFIDEAPATVASIKTCIEDLAHEWGGWPDDWEINEYRTGWEVKEERKDNYLYRSWYRMGFASGDTVRTRLRRENIRMIEEGEDYSEDEDQDI